MKLYEYIKQKEELAIKNGLEKEPIKIMMVELEYNSLANLIANYQNEIDINKWDSILNKYIRNNIPMQYILGYAYFYGNKFKVTKDTLIPRPETEILVNETIKIIKAQNKPLKILDIGTGTGAIIISIANAYKNLAVNTKPSTISFNASDVSKKALDCAKENAKQYQLAVNFIQSDIYQNINDKYDIIVSNPPYIKTNDYVQSIVYNNEPHLALYGGDDGLDFYRRIITKSNDYLNSYGYILFEIGSTQGEDVKRLALEKYPKSNVQIMKDYNNLDRIVIIYKGE